MLVSVIIPVYNENNTILDIIELVKNSDVDKEIIVVDDGSTDGTKEKLKKVKDIKVIYHDYNKGKGSSIRTGLEYAEGDIVIIQDADLEYNPDDFRKLLEPVLSKDALAVYGSRFKGKGDFKPLSFIANKFLTFLVNFLYNARLTDMETCYKCIKTNILKELNLSSERFEIEPEITTKLLKKNIRIYEVPISYRGRKEGKKIGFTDGIDALFTLLKYKIK